MKNSIKKMISVFVICLIFISGCKKDINDSDQSFVIKNNIIYTAINNIKITLTSNVSPASYNPEPIIDSNFEEVNDNSSNKLLATNMLNFIDRVVSSKKVELYGVEEQIVSGIILDDNTTTMKFRIIIDESNNQFIFEIACVGAKYYNAYMCLDASYNYSSNTLISYSIIIDGDCTPNMQEYIKYDGNRLYTLINISSISSSITSKYNNFNNLASTHSGYNFIEEYGE